MNKDVGKTLVLISQFGISMIVPIALCMLHLQAEPSPVHSAAWTVPVSGSSTDKLSAPIITVPFFIIGALAGFRNVYILARSVYQDDKKKEQDDDKKHEQHP